jgi:RNA polymerase sigma factor (sigma-70 family)
LDGISPRIEISCPNISSSGHIGCEGRGDLIVSRSEAWFDGLYERHHRDVLAYCLRRLGRSEAYDAAAEVFTVAWRRREDVPVGEKALAWLYGVARNMVSHQWRTALRLRRLTGRVARIASPAVPDPAAVVVEREEYALVRTALERLRPIDQEVLRLSAWEGLSRGEIARILDSSLAAVDKRVTRAKQRLAKEFEALNRSNQHRPPASAIGGGDGR